MSNFHEVHKKKESNTFQHKLIRLIKIKHRTSNKYLYERYQ